MRFIQIINPQRPQETVDEYLELTRVSRREEDLREEVNRLRNSFSFQFGNVFVRAIERPITILLLPFSVVHFMYKRAFKDKKSTKKITKITRNCIIGYSAESPRGIHFERMEIILEELRKFGIQTIHVTNDSEIRSYEKLESHSLYSIPSRLHFNDMIPRTWNRKIERIFSGILDTFHPRTMIFDGDYPFRGVLNSISLRPEMNRFWIRESLLNFKITSLPIDAFDTFDAVIHPSVERRDDPDTIIGDSGTVFCNPIIANKKKEKSLLQLRNKLNLEGKQVVFVQLSKSLNNLEDIFSRLLSEENVQLLCLKSSTPKKYIRHENVTTYNDISTGEAIQVADVCFISPDFFNIYSCFHNQKPTMCIVESKTNLDSIYREFGTQNLPIVLIENEKDGMYISNSIERLLNEQLQEQLIQRMSKIDLEDGTPELCQYIRSLHDSNQV